MNNNFEKRLLKLEGTAPTADPFGIDQMSHEEATARFIELVEQRAGTAPLTLEGALRLSDELDDTAR